MSWRGYLFTLKNNSAFQKDCWIIYNVWQFSLNFSETYPLNNVNSHTCKILIKHKVGEFNHCIGFDCHLMARMLHCIEAKRTCPTSEQKNIDFGYSLQDCFSVQFITCRYWANLWTWCKYLGVLLGHANIRTWCKYHYIHLRWLNLK